MESFSADEFEIFTYHWAHFYLAKTNKYVQVQRRGGAGDKGCDIVAWIDPDGTMPRRWDNFQCKHYDNQLTPTDVYIELAKLCWFSFTGAFTVPNSYYFVSPRGLGNKLDTLLSKPDELKSSLISNWSRYCETELTATPVKLEGAFLDHVNSFNFGILKSIEPLELIEQHGKTPYHYLVFGMFLRDRAAPATPPNTISNSESRYVSQLYDVYSELTNRSISHSADIVEADLTEHFADCRKNFYCAESLKEFARDSLPDDGYYEELLEEILAGVNLCLFDQFNSSLHKLNSVCKAATQLVIESNVLKSKLKVQDKIGMCHHLANQDKIIWVQKK